MGMHMKCMYVYAYLSEHSHTYTHCWGGKKSVSSICLCNPLFMRQYLFFCTSARHFDWIGWLVIPRNLNAPPPIEVIVTHGHT